MNAAETKNPTPEHKSRIQILADEIIEQCRQQSFKAGEFELLIEALSRALDERVYRFKHELF